MSKAIGARSWGEFLGVRPALFYGATVAVALMGWERFCPMAG